MSKRRPVAILAMRKCAQEFRDSLAKINGEAQDCAQLDDDGVHLPIAIAEVDVKQRFGYAQVRC